jgi:hypothetical protein
MQRVKSLLVIEDEHDEAPAIDEDLNKLKDLLFNWKNPVAINVAGALICMLILIATFS